MNQNEIARLDRCANEYGKDSVEYLKVENEILHNIIVKMDLINDNKREYEALIEKNNKTLTQIQSEAYHHYVDLKKILTSIRLHKLITTALISIISSILTGTVIYQLIIYNLTKHH